MRPIVAFVLDLAEERIHARGRRRKGTFSVRGMLKLWGFLERGDDVSVEVSVMHNWPIESYDGIRRGDTVVAEGAEARVVGLYYNGAVARAEVQGASKRFAVDAGDLVRLPFPAFFLAGPILTPPDFRAMCREVARTGTCYCGKPARRVLLASVFPIEPRPYMVCSVGHEMPVFAPGDTE